MAKIKKLVPKKDLAAVVRSLQNRAGTVTYTFRTERYNIKNDKIYYNLSRQVIHLNPQAFLQENGDRKTPYQLWEMLESFRKDIGAAYFALN